MTSASTSQAQADRIFERCYDRLYIGNACSRSHRKSALPQQQQARLPVELSHSPTSLVVHVAAAGGLSALNATAPDFRLSFFNPAPRAPNLELQVHKDDHAAATH
jgi:hypothetical protein